MISCMYVPVDDGGGVRYSCMYIPVDDGGGVRYSCMYVPVDDGGWGKVQTVSVLSVKLDTHQVPT